MSFKIGIFGDAHGNLETIKSWQDLDETVDMWIQLGDLSVFSAMGRILNQRTFEKGYSIISTVSPLPRKLYFLRGNHDQLGFTSIEKQRYAKRNIYSLKDGLYVNSMVPGYNVIVYGWCGSDEDNKTWKGWREKWKEDDIKNKIVETKKNLLPWIIFSHGGVNSFMETPYMEDKLKTEIDDIQLWSLMLIAKPKYFFHGHYHQSYTWYHEDWGMRVYGINKDNAKIIEIN
jgi:predicted phosphodiesterase